MNVALAVALTLAGILAVVVEFYVPGGIMVILGGILIGLGMYVFAFGDVNSLTIGLFVLGQLTALCVAVYYTIKRVYRTREKGGMTHHKDMKGYVGVSTDPVLINQEGVAAYDMKPSGHVTINGVDYQAVSTAGYVKKGEKIKVISTEQGYYIITKI
ncbi:hypothetical protein N9N03_00280 [Chlamydiia bacterium]|nr:hypothetical protein [Chlamydiia bacterium]